MNDSLPQAVLEALEYLQTLEREGVRPDEARVRLQAVRAHHPELAIDLLAEVECCDQSVHYDVLLRRAGAGTVSLSYCPERAVPWPLRGLHHATEFDLVRVNGHVLTVEKAIACLDSLWENTRVMEGLVNAALLRQEWERAPFKLTDAEIQEAMDRFRSAKKLFKAKDTERWLQGHGMTHASLENLVSENAQVDKLRDRIVGDRVEEYFRQHSADFDTARLARLEVADESQARELAAQIRAGRQDFFAAAERCFLEKAEQGKVPKGDLFTAIERRQAAPALREQLFAATPGQLIGPVPLESGYALMRVLAIVPAGLDNRTRAVIKNLLFEDWLTERRQAAQIEWCWGNVSKTG